jgi:predicted MPP superfamily phosphohydrolase
MNPRREKEKDKPSRWTRRRVLRLLAGAATVGAGIDALWWEPRRLVVEPVSFRFRDLPSELDGLRLAQLSDFHRSPWVRQGEIERAVAVTNTLAPDLVVLTGDYVSLRRRYAEPCAAALSELRAPLGRFAVLGNHDHWLGPKRVAAALRQAGLTVLRNAAVPVARRGADLWLVGVDDAFVHRDDLSLALRGVPGAAFKVVLLHEPDLADMVSRYPVQLQLSGHSHGGQVRLPGLGPILLPRMGRKYPMGRRQVARLQLYTSRGIGRIQPAVRFNCPPEVTLITLRRD